MMRLSEAVTPLNAVLNGSDLEFTSVSIDTRTLQEGALYVAIEGEQFDGHDFIEDAIAKGAVAAIVSRPIDTSMPTLHVKDTRLALGALAKYWRNTFSPKVVAITGSCGKTTVKEMMASILRQQGEVLVTKGNLNNDYGVPLTLLNLREHHQFAVIEMGANHLGEIDYLARIVCPDVAVITLIAPAHIEGFGSVEGVAKAKSEIFNGLKQPGVAVVNMDERCKAILDGAIQSHSRLSFSIDNLSANVSAEDLSTDEDCHCHFVLNTPMGKTSIQLPVLGQHNVSNALCAAAAAHALEVPLAAIKKGLEEVSAVNKRLLVKQGHNGSRIIDDTYNANLESVRAALNVLSQYPGKKIFVMGDMGELGDQSIEHHQQLGQLARDLAIDAMYVKGELIRHALGAFGDNAHHYPSYESLIEELRQLLAPDVTVLVKGSRAAAMEHVVAGLIQEYI